MYLLWVFTSKLFEMTQKLTASLVQMEVVSVAFPRWLSFKT